MKGDGLYYSVSDVHDKLENNKGYYIINLNLPWNDPNRIDWAIHPECANQIGCIHTVQGLEMDYVGHYWHGPGYDEETNYLIVR